MEEKGHAASLFGNAHLFLTAFSAKGAPQMTKSRSSENRHHERLRGKTFLDVEEKLFTRVSPDVVFSELSPLER